MSPAPANPQIGRVVEAPLHEVLYSRFLNYAMSVITDRALPDVRDGLKPVQRRILYAMYHDLHLTPERPTLKCAKVVGQVLGSYHPHGDSAVYEALARMAQDWTLRYPLVFGQGNFGSIDGDSPAAYRYTEARLSPLALEFVEELGQETVDFAPNFDESVPEPQVLPAQVPQMLINGCIGIAVGVATNIPPHNLGEVLRACKALIDNRQLPISKLLDYIQGPDFPTGGELLNDRQSLEQIYSEGQGALKVRATYALENVGKRHFQIVINSIPYMVNKAELVEEIANIILGGKVPQLVDVRDESTQEVRIVLDCRCEGDPQTIMAYLFKHTKLQNQFNVNMTCLVGREGEARGPERVNLRTALLEFIDFRFQVTLRRLHHEARLLRERLHILEGLIKLFDALDEAIALIRVASSRQEAGAKLRQRFLLDEVQTEAILELRLYRLSQKDILLIHQEMEEKAQRLAQIEALVLDMPALWNLVKGDLESVRRKYADSRRTLIQRHGAQELVYNAEDFIVTEPTLVLITQDGWLRRVAPDCDLSKLRLRPEDALWLSLESETSSSLLLFSNLGVAYTLAIHELPSGARGLGEPVQKFFTFSDGEKIVAALTLDPKESQLWQAPALDSEAPESSGEAALPPMQALALSEDGRGLRFSLANFLEPSKKTGRKFMRCEESKVLSVETVRGKETLIVLSEQNRALLCPVAEINFMTGVARGVQVMKLEEGDKLCAQMVVTGPDQGMLLARDSSSPTQELSLAKQKIAKRGGKGTVLAKRGKLYVQEKFYARQ